MPVEIGRTTKRKRIALPSGSHVDIPVITNITFIDASDRYQEIQFTVDNSAKGARTVHVVDLSGDVDGSPMSGLQVERIDLWPVLDPNDRYQETQASLDNVTGEDALPYPHFRAHFMTHNVTYTSAQDSQAAVITELIDEVRVLDPNDRYQETRLVLTNNPPVGVYTLDETDPDISDTANGIDPPYRTDPFQNIVAWRDTAGHPPPPWFGLYPASALALMRWNTTNANICYMEDSPANSSLGNFGRPLSYGLCDWPIADPLPCPGLPAFDWAEINYSAGTIYKTRSEFEEAFSHTKSSGNIAWHYGVSGFTEDASLAEGALCPEVNDYFTAWFDRNAEFPQYVPVPEFRVFLIEDDQWETWMAGIHDLVDLPTI